MGYSICSSGPARTSRLPGRFAMLLILVHVLLASLHHACSLVILPPASCAFVIRLSPWFLVAPIPRVSHISLSHISSIVFAACCMYYIATLYVLEESKWCVPHTPSQQHRIVPPSLGWDPLPTQDTEHGAGSRYLRGQGGCIRGPLARRLAEPGTTKHGNELCQYGHHKRYSDRSQQRT